MDLFGRLLGGDLSAGTPGPADDFWFGPAGGVLTPAGMRVDEHGAQNLSAWFRGRLILQIIVAMMPLPVYRRLPNDGGAEPAPYHPLYDVVHDQPNDTQDSFQWRVEQMGDLIDRGHGYNWIVPGPRGFVHQLCRIDPTLVTEKQQVTTLANGAVIPGRMLYDIRNAQTGRTNTFTQDEVFHLRAPGGKGILEHARMSLGTALATEAFAAATFGRGALNGGVIENPGVLDKEPSERMAKSFITAAGDWRLPKILEQGSKFIESKLSPEDFQMLLSRKFGVDDIARWLGVSRQLLENSDPSFGNADQFWQSFLTISMGGWLSLFEFGINGQLIIESPKYYARFTRQAIARGDLAARWAAHVAAVNAGIVTVDEVRGVEDLNKRGGKADELREPQNITGKPTAEAPVDEPPKTKPVDDPPPRKRAAVPDDEKARAIVTESAARVLRKELQFATRAAVKYADDPEAYAAAVDAFYADHHVLVMATMLLEEPAARAYVAIQRADLHDGLAVTATWTPAYLASLALDRPTVDPMPGLLKAAIEKPAAPVTVHSTIAKGAVEAIVHAHAAPVTVHAPVTIDDGAVRVDAPVTIAKGAIQHDTHVAAPAARTTVVDKTVTYNANNKITKVREEHREKD